MKTPIKIKDLEPGDCFRIKGAEMLFTRIHKPYDYRAKGKILATIRGDRTIIKFDPDFEVIKILFGGRKKIVKKYIQLQLF